jgi:deazaflavin-dependent oxidoreductase (nitroreductase family)
MALFLIFIRLQTAIFRLTHGKLMASLRGMPVLLLTTVGRRTGKPRTRPLMYIRDGNNYVVTASNNGQAHNPGWFHNLRASPRVEIEVPGKQVKATASVASDLERSRLWLQLVARAPFFEGYRKSASRTIPMVILTPE